MTTGQKEKALPNNQTFHAARPPQINWASRPIARTDIPTGSEALVSTDSLQPPETAINPTGRRLVAVYVDADRLTQLEGVLSQLGLPFLLTPGPDHRHLDHFKCAPQKKEEPHVSDQLVELEQMTASLSTLSTSEDFDMKPSNLFSPRSLIPNTPHTSFLVSPGKKRYYSITVGKCTGVYWDTWDNVESLIKHVPDARYKGFSTHSAAAEHYFEAKKALKVKVVRNPGDEMKYGPMGSAAQ